LISTIFSILLFLQPDCFRLKEAVLHDYKMSVCEVVYQPATTGMEVKFYLFTDDLTAALTGNPTAALPGREVIGQYILQHFQLKVNGNAQNLQFYAIRQKDEQVLVQFNTGAISGNISNIAVTNSLLTEKFKEQTNVVYAIVPGNSKKTEMLDHNKTSAYFYF
jgi:hypothetical protein